MSETPATLETVETLETPVLSPLSLESCEEYNDNISKCVRNDTVHTDNIGSKLIVAVMTVCADLGSPVNLLKIFDLYTQGKCDENFELDYVPNTKQPKDGSAKNKAFYNCLSVLFYFKDSDLVENKISAKVFPNGSIQLPGCRTIDAVSKGPQILFDFIKNLIVKNPEIVISPETFKLQNVRIVMINSNFVFQQVVVPDDSEDSDASVHEDEDEVVGEPKDEPKTSVKQIGIIQERLKDLINSRKFEGKENPQKIWRMATYQPEKYAGVNIRYWTKSAREKYAPYFLEGRRLPKKVEGQVSIFIFRSGKGTITAAKNSKDLMEAYHAICDLIAEHSEELLYNRKF